MRKILIPTKLDLRVSEMLSTSDFIPIQDEKTPLAELALAHPDAAGIIVRSEKVTPAIIDALPNLKLIVRAGAGYDNIDCKYARRSKVDVMNTPGANSNAVAEEVVAMMLAVIRHLVPADLSTRRGAWEKNLFMGSELTAKSVGIIGLGNIGRLVAKRISGFECKLLGYDPALSAELAKQIGVELVSLEELFQHSDFITLHIPETDETRNLIGEKLLSLAKPNLVLINCARSGIVDENALRSAKTLKNIRYCTDVYPQDEPGLKPVADIANIMLPHLGASTLEANSNAAKRAAEQTIAYFEKGSTACVVNKSIPDGLAPNYQNLALVITRIARSYLGSNQPPHQIEITLYGKLAPFFEWMLAPIAHGISPEFDPFLDASDAHSFFQNRGITLINRDPDNSKNYGESISLDLYQGSDHIHKVSIRGTVTENHLMISRINHYNHLYLEPSGHNLFVEYSDEPGVIGRIASILGLNDINILDIRAPQDLKVNRSLAVIKTNIPVPNSLFRIIESQVKQGKAFSITVK